MRYALMAFAVFSAPLLASPRIINGKVVEAGKYQEVVKVEAIQTNGTLGAPCTGTIVGPKVVLTAAHCVVTGGMAKITANGKTYQARMQRSPLYPAKDRHDMAVGVLENEILGVEPASIGGRATTGLGMILLGYGCDINGGGTIDGILRWGETMITGVSDYDMDSSKQGGAALCFGDSGGPAFLTENGKRLVIGVNSKGNLEDSNSHVRLDIAASTSFLSDFATKNSVEICGVNKNCGSVTPSPTPSPSPSPTPSPTPTPPPAPQCEVKVDPQTLVLGQNVTATLRTSGVVTGATLNGVSIAFPLGQRTWQPEKTGPATAVGRVVGPGGSANCTASYQVNPPSLPAPKCQLTANPSSIKLGEFLILTLQIEGSATSAKILDQNVTLANPSLKYTPGNAGFQSATGTVSGAGGTNSCAVSYQVKGPTPNIPNYAVIPTYCGDNTVAESTVKQVCLGLVKYTWENREMAIPEVLVLTFSDASVEVLPVISSKEYLFRPNALLKAELSLYANTHLNTSQGLVLATRKATLTKEMINGQAPVPKAIEGRSGKDNQQYFLVERLKKVQN